MSCLTVNTQVTKNVVTPVIKVENIVNRDVKEDDKDGVSRDVDATVHYPDTNPYDALRNEDVSKLILSFILNDLDVNNGIILLSIDEMKKVLKVLCHCDDVIIDVASPEIDVSCCSSSLRKQFVDRLEVKKILLQYNDRDCLEDFKMHYNEIKILTESYKVDIDHVKNIIEEIVV